MTFIHRSGRSRSVILGASLLVAATATPALGHAGIPDGSAVVSGSSAVIHVRIGHGCEGLPVDTVEVQLPDGIVSARPEYVPGWGLEVEMVESEPYDQWGTTMTERVGVIRWTDGDLPDFAYYDFGIKATFLAEPGTYWVPVVQRCGEQEIAWIEIPAEGQDHDALEHPAAELTIVAPETEPAS